MASQQQIEANRQNAQKSTGPKTEEGKAAVRLNSVKPGLTASTIVLSAKTPPSSNPSSTRSKPSTLPPPHRNMLVRQLAMAAGPPRFYHGRKPATTASA